MSPHDQVESKKIDHVGTNYAIPTWLAHIPLPHIHVRADGGSVTGACRPFSRMVEGHSTFRLVVICLPSSTPQMWKGFEGCANCSSDSWRVSVVLVALALASHRRTP